MSKEDDDRLRESIGRTLTEGLKTQTEPFPKDDVEFAKVLAELAAIEPKDLTRKLVVGGFVDHPYGEDRQRCLECMYYLVHRKWCELPELDVPVEPEWWCRLWRI